jgi:hypothetical protein
VKRLDTASRSAARERRNREIRQAQRGDQGLRGHVERVGTDSLDA